MKKTIKKIVALLVVISMCIGISELFMPDKKVQASNQNDNTIYTVLMLDLGGGPYHTLEGDNIDIFEIHACSDEIKAAAIKYVKQSKSQGRNEKIAVVSYGRFVTTVCDFTDDENEVIEKIENAVEYRLANVRDALIQANSLFEDKNIQKENRNIINFTKGFCGNGQTRYNGPYTDEDCVWSNAITWTNCCGHTNAAYEAFQTIKGNNNIYTVHLSKKYDTFTENRTKLVEFSKRFAKDIQNAGYIEVDDVDNLVFDFDGWNSPIISVPFKFASSYALKDIDAVCYYSDSYFEKPATDYNDHLATMSLCLELATWSSLSEYTVYTDDVNHAFPKFINARGLLSKIGFKGFAVNDMWDAEPTPDSVGVVTANRVLPDGSTVIALAVRGGNYGQEWAGNFTIGLTGEHKAWTASKNVIIEFLYEYLEAQNITGDVKLWIVGYSKGGAVANLVASELSYAFLNGKDYSWEKEDVYAYTFESPQGAQEGFALLRKYENIHNVLNVNDIITLVAPKEWGFARYGERELLPNPKYVGDDFTTYKEGMEKYLEQFVKSDEKNEFDIQTTVTYRRPMFFRNPALGVTMTPVYEEKEVLTKDLIENVVSFIAEDLIESRENYYYNYQAILRDLLCIKNGGDLDSIFDEKYLETDLWEVILENLTYKNFMEIISPIYGKDNIGIRRQKIWDNCEKFIQQVVEEHDLAFSTITISRLGETLQELLWNLSKAYLKESTLPNMGDLYNLYELIQLISKGVLTQPHYPEVTLAWMMYKDNYYGENDNIKVGRTYRTIHINCPVDVNVYSEDSGKLVAAIYENVPQEMDDSYIVTYLNKDGEKIVILPADTNYKIEIVAAETCEFNFTIDEYSYDLQENVRIINYYDIPINTGDIYIAHIPALEEDELYVSNEVGSTSTYALSAHDGTEVVPNVEFRGADATNACYNVNVSQKNEFGYILGGGEYSAGSFAEVCASPMYGGEFLGWYSDDVLISSDSVYRFAVKENIELEARFTEVELYDISFISNEGGVVLNEALQVPEGVEINLLAVPFEGYEFDYWLGVDINNMDNLSDSDAKYKVGNSDAIIQANFRKIEQVQDIVDNNTTTENTDEEADINDTETSEKNNDIESSVDVNSGKITLCYILCSLAVNSIIIFAIMLIDKRKARL